MSEGSLRYRQVHLDFHTSPRIPGVGSRFDADAFGDAFKAAHVDSVTVFSKCHHGLSYHPTDVGRMHPTLAFDLLRAQVEALHARGINAVVYLSSTWDEHAADAHADWRAVSPDGSLPRFRAAPAGAGWAMMDFSTPYLDYLCAQVDEAMRLFPDADGVFMDISWQVPTISAHARGQMEAQGLDWTDAAHRERFTAQAVEAYYDRVTTLVRAHDPAMPLFFNAGHIRRGLRDHYRRHYSHLEVESLPTAAWGYDHFPLSARYVDTLGFDYLGMTGKFHWSWGEVGGYKKPEALLYECGAMLAQGARCSVGDHLHPTGAIDASTMAVISSAYAWVAAREPWCLGTVNVAEIGLLSVEAMTQSGLGRRPDKNTVPDEGAARVMLEGGFTFDVLDLESDLAPYRLVILPDVVRVDATLKARIEAYLAQGGRVLMTGRSGLGPEGFALDVGAAWEGTSPMTGGDFLLPIPELRAEGVDDPLFMYRPSERIRLTDGASLGEVFDPYMDRRPQYFSGHVNAPSDPAPNGFAAGSAKGAVTYAAHPIFSCYHQAGSVAMLEVAEKLVAHALGAPRTIRTSLPRAGRATLRRSPRGSDVLHLLHATPAVRGDLGDAALQPIQDLLTLHDVEVSLAREAAVAAVTLVPEGTALPFALAEGRLGFTVTRLRGHQMVEIAAG